MRTVPKLRKISLVKKLSMNDRNLSLIYNFLTRNVFRSVPGRVIPKTQKNGN